MSRAVVLHSGGMDSTVALALAKKLHRDVVSLTILYGSSHESMESLAADVISRKMRIQHEAFNVPSFIFKGGKSALMDETSMPKSEYTTEGPNTTEVPFRNANFISIAVAYALARSYDYVYIAAHASDHDKWAYPDCSPEFLGAMAAATYVGTYHRVRLKFPFVYMTKSELVKMGELLGVPWSLTYSCYTGGLHHCGFCPTCRERIRAFQEAGIGDPTTYEREAPNVSSQ